MASSSSDEKMARLETLQTHDLELGATDAVQKHFARHVIERKPVTQRRLDLEHRRPRWIRECAAEAAGTFFYVLPGIASTAIFLLEQTSPSVSAFGSFLQIGLAYAFGIAFAIIVCAPTSGGHFSPAITISLAIWQGFPLSKVPRYILSQVFGAFLAGLLLMGMYRPEIAAFEEATLAAGGRLVSSVGPAAILISIPTATQTNLGYVFLTEFFVSAFVAVVIWACLDRANPFVSPQSAPFIIGLAYAVVIWGFAGITISINTGKDLGCRIVAAIFYGSEAFTDRNYAAIAGLVNIPATLFGTAFYEFFLRDSLITIGMGGALHAEGDEGLKKHISRPGVLPDRH